MRFSPAQRGAALSPLRAPHRIPADDPAPEADGEADLAPANKELHHAGVVPHHRRGLLLRPHRTGLPPAAVQHLYKDRPLVQVRHHSRSAHPAAVPHFYKAVRQAEGPLQHKAVWQVLAVEAPDPCSVPHREAAGQPPCREQVQHHNKGLLLVAVRQAAAAHLPDKGTSVFHLSRWCRSRSPIQRTGSSPRRSRVDHHRSLRGSSRARRMGLRHNSDRDEGDRLHQR